MNRIANHRPWGEFGTRRTAREWRSFGIPRRKTATGLPLFCFLLGVLIASPAWSSGPLEVRTPNPRDEASTLRHIWDSWNTIELTCEEFMLDAQGERDRSRPYMRHEFRFKKPSRYALVITSVKPDGESKVLESIRGDGRVRTAIRSFPGFANEVSGLHLMNQESTEERYEDTKFSALWLVMPGGRPLAAYLAEGGTLTRAENHGPTHYILEARHRENPLRCILDSNRDWLPIRVELEARGQSMYWEATRFTQDNHRWFPVEGRFTAPMSDGTLLKGFSVLRLAVNRPIDDGAFAVPKIPDGVRVEDDITGNSHFQGGREAWLRRRRFFGAQPVNSQRDLKNIVASRTPEAAPWPWLIAGGATAALFLAGAAWIRSRAS